jgi:hypothetical protein
MTLEDLEYIFKPQIDEGTTKLYFILKDGDAMTVIERHPAEDLEGLLPMLSHFQYHGSEVMPRFVK